MKTKILSAAILLFAFIVMSSGNLFAQNTMDALLKKGGIDYTKTTQEGVIKFSVEIEDESIIMYAYERKIFEGSKAETNIMCFYTRALRTPEKFKYPHEMLLKLAKLNDDLPLGRVSISNDGDIYYSTTIYLDASDEKILYKEILFAFQVKGYVKETLSPFLEENK